MNNINNMINTIIKKFKENFPTCQFIIEKTPWYKMLHIWKLNEKNNKRIFFEFDKNNKKIKAELLYKHKILKYENENVNYLLEHIINELK